MVVKGSIWLLFANAESVKAFIYQWCKGVWCSFGFVYFIKSLTLMPEYQLIKL